MPPSFGKSAYLAIESFSETRRSLLLLVALLSILLPSIDKQYASAQPIKSGNSYALLVACDKYDEKHLKSLQYTRNDIIGLQNILIESGFKIDNIIAMYDRQRDSKFYKIDPLAPEGANIRRKLKELLEKVGEKDELIVALSGHGIQFRGETKHYFCPCDADLDDRNSLIDLNEIYQMLAGNPCQRKLLLVDACRNDPRSNRSKAARPTMELESVTRPQEDKIPEGLVALFSCSEGQESYEDPDVEHGIFFYELMKGWHAGAVTVSGQVRLEDLIQYATDQTAKHAAKRFQARQAPEKKNELSATWVLTQYSGEIRRMTADGLTTINSVHLTRGGQWVVACTRGEGDQLSTTAADLNTKRPELLIWDAVSGRLLKRWTIHVGVA
jgi:hypothetical protein